MPSIISASTTSGTALSLSSDTSGELQIRTGSTPTTAVTIDSNQNFNFSKTGQRITGDFSNATVANRVAFQTSTIDANSNLYLIPNGTATTAQHIITNSSDLSATSTGTFAFIQANSTDARIGGTRISASGSFIPLTFYTSNSERLRIDTSGNVGIATTSPSSFGKFAVQGASTNRVFYADSLAQPVARYDDNSFVSNGLTIRNSGITGSNQGIGLLFQLGVSGTPVDAGAIQIRSEADFSTSANQDAAMTFATVLNGTSAERMRIDSSGNVGIGTSSPTSFGSTYTVLDVFNTANGGALVLRGGDVTTALFGDDSVGGLLETRTNHPFVFRTNQIERMRITSGGDLLVGTTTAGTKFYVLQAANSLGSIIRCTDANFSNHPLDLAVDRNTTNNSYYFIRAAVTGVAYRFQVADSGNVTNTNGSYGTISDVKLKENIVDATPKLDKVNQLKVRNFNLIGDELKQIGFVAQEFEEVFPSMVEESPDKDMEGNDLGTTTKMIKTTVLIPILVKAIQELNAKVVELEAKLK